MLTLLFIDDALLCMSWLSDMFFTRRDKTFVIRLDDGFAGVLRQFSCHNGKKVKKNTCNCTFYYINRGRSLEFSKRGHTVSHPEYLPDCRHPRFFFLLKVTFFWMCSERGGRN